VSGDNRLLESPAQTFGSRAWLIGPSTELVLWIHVSRAFCL